MEDLSQLREEMDNADDALLKALEQRMRVAEKIGNFKKSSGKPIYDGLREREKLSAIYDKADELTQPFVPPIYSLLFPSLSSMSFEASRSASWKARTMGYFSIALSKVP